MIGWERRGDSPGPARAPRAVYPERRHAHFTRAASRTLLAYDGPASIRRGFAAQAQIGSCFTSAPRQCRASSGAGPLECEATSGSPAQGPSYPTADWPTCAPTSTGSAPRASARPTACAMTVPSLARESTAHCHWRRRSQSTDSPLVPPPRIQRHCYLGASAQTAVYRKFPTQALTALVAGS
jgi:hypothetical protein